MRHPRPSNHGMLVNRIWHAGRRLRQVIPDHDIGGFVVVADYDETPPVVQFLPIVGLTLCEEDDGSATCGSIGLYTMASDGTIECWDLAEALPDDVLGVTPTLDDAVRDTFTTRALARLLRMRERSDLAEALASEGFGGPVS